MPVRTRVRSPSRSESIRAVKVSDSNVPLRPARKASCPRLLSATSSKLVNSAPSNAPPAPLRAMRSRAVASPRSSPVIMPKGSSPSTASSECRATWPRSLNCSNFSGARPESSLVRTPSATVCPSRAMSCNWPGAPAHTPIPNTPAVPGADLVLAINATSPKSFRRDRSRSLNTVPGKPGATLPVGTGTSNGLLAVWATTCRPCGLATSSASARPPK